MAEDRKSFTCGEDDRYRVDIEGELGTKDYTATVYDTKKKEGFLVFFKRMVRIPHDLSKILEGVPTRFMGATIKRNKLILIIQYEMAHNNELPLDLP